jgi:APA family basic amino acid/polyamine antiporter
VVLAFAMPLSSVLSGVAVLGIGVAAYALRRVMRRMTQPGDRGDAIPTRPERED